MITTGDKHISQEANGLSDDKVLSDDEVAFYHRFTKFSSVWDPIAAMMWISDMEDAFKVMNCTDDDKATYAVSMLRSEARIWWDAVKGTTNMTWTRFKEVFKDEFYPVSMEVELMQRFRTLKQGKNESVRKYTTCFNRLWWFFANHLTRERRLIYMYVGGLPPFIKDQLSASDMTTLESAMNVSSVINEDYKIWLEENKYLKKKHERIICINCVKKHEGECGYGSMGCYRCGEVGHLARNCHSYY